jgi:AraC-like DNA-binding protein
LPEYVWRNAPTVREMFLRLHRYSLLLDEATTNTFRSERGEAILELSAPLDPSCLGRHGNELAMAFIVRVLKETMPASWRPRRLWFAHAAPDDHTPLSAYFRTRNISFGCRANGIALDAADLDVPLTGADPALFALLDEQARSGVEGQRHPDDFQTRLRDHLGLALRDGLPCLDDVAASVGMSARTLQRRLAEEGTHFGAFLDDVRRNLAFVYLVNRHLELSQIADLLRYSDVGTFVRAFRRWTGTTPGEYRKQHVRGE